MTQSGYFFILEQIPNLSIKTHYKISQILPIFLSVYVKKCTVTKAAEH